MTADALVVLVAAAIWAVGSAGLAIYMRENKSSSDYEELWPWMYVPMVRDAFGAAFLVFIGLPLLLAVAGFYIVMFLIGPGLIISGIFDSSGTPVERILKVAGGAAIASVFTWGSVYFLKKDWWDQIRWENRRKRFRRDNEQS